ncbi:hypothetical protein MTO96_024171 [Rhipicephalus appendiculatus]
MSVPAKPTLANPTLPRPTQLWSPSNTSSTSSSKPTTTAKLKLSATTPFSWERLRMTTSTSTTPQPATVVRVFSNKIGSSVMATAGTPRTTTSTTPSTTTAADVKENVIGNGRDRGFPFEFFTDVNKLVSRTTPQPQPVYKPPASREPVTEVVTAISFSESALAA